MVKYPTFSGSRLTPPKKIKVTSEDIQAPQVNQIFEEYDLFREDLRASIENDPSRENYQRTIGMLDQMSDEIGSLGFDTSWEFVDDVRELSELAAKKRVELNPLGYDLSDLLLGNETNWEDYRDLTLTKIVDQRSQLSKEEAKIQKAYDAERYATIQKIVQNYNLGATVDLSEYYPLLDNDEIAVLEDKNINDETRQRAAFFLDKVDSNEVVRLYEQGVLNPKEFGLIQGEIARRQDKLKDPYVKEIYDEFKQNVPYGLTDQEKQIRENLFFQTPVNEQTVTQINNKINMMSKERRLNTIRKSPLVTTPLKYMDGDKLEEIKIKAIDKLYNNEMDLEELLDSLDVIDALEVELG